MRWRWLQSNDARTVWPRVGPDMGADFHLLCMKKANALSKSCPEQDELPFLIIASPVEIPLMICSWDGGGLSLHRD